VTPQPGIFSASLMRVPLMTSGDSWKMTSVCRLARRRFYVVENSSCYPVTALQHRHLIPISSSRCSFVA
jgi:hypothetical protein